MARMDSAFIDNYRFLARYNRWFNQRLYAAYQRAKAKQLAEP